jgi:hypothetical protein
LQLVSRQRFDAVEETYPTTAEAWPWRPMKLLDKPERRLETRADWPEAPATS